jgi:Tol biopolymer transport system component
VRPEPITSEQLHLRVPVAWFIAAAGLLLASCDKVPTRPGNSPAPPAGPTVQRSTGPIAFASNRDGPSQIYLANADGSLVTRLTQGIHPSWSPDGWRIAFAGPSYGVYVINADGTGLRLIAQGIQPAWSPDGRRIAYMYGHCCPITGGIFVVDVDGGGARQLVDHALAAIHLTMSVNTASSTRRGRPTGGASRLVFFSATRSPLPRRFSS